MLYRAFRVFSLCLFGPAIPAATIVLEAVDSGWYHTRAEHNPANENYIAGTTDGLEFFRNFFVFDLSAVTDMIVSAEFRAYNPGEGVPGDGGNGFHSPSGSERFTLGRVHVPVERVIAGTDGPGGEVFRLLGAGAIYGTHIFTAADNGTIVSIPLNETALADLNAAAGLFLMGGTISTLGPEIEAEFVFALTKGATGPGTVSNTTRELVVVTQDTVVPEPTGWWLAVGGCGALWTLRRCRAIPRKVSVKGSPSRTQ